MLLLLLLLLVFVMPVVGLVVVCICAGSFMAHEHPLFVGQGPFHLLIFPPPQFLEPAHRTRAAGSGPLRPKGGEDVFPQRSGRPAGREGGDHAYGGTSCQLHPQTKSK